MKKYTEKQIRASLDRLNNESTGNQWVIKDNQLVKTFKFTSFIEAFSWMTQVAIWSEKLNHHPHWYNTYHKVDVSLCTHDINGITELDFALAHKMEFCSVQ